MEIAYIYLCNACEKIGFEIFKGISDLHKEKSIGEQINDRLHFTEFRCMNCKVQKNYLQKVRFIHKKEMIELYNDLEGQREECLKHSKPIILHA